MTVFPTKIGFSPKALLGLAAVLAGAGAPARAADAFRHHRYASGETVRFEFEDSDTIFLAAPKDGTIQAGDAIKVQEIRLPVSIEISTPGAPSPRTLTISPSASYRAAPPAALSTAPFRRLGELDPKIPPSFSYAYRDDTDALNRMQTIFADVRKSETGGFLFYKMEDVHQMQESVERIPEGMLPGQVHRTEAHEREGLGGKFVAAPSQLVYQSTETLNGIKAGYFKVVSLGHQFTIPGIKTYTNFTFTLHVALEGPRQGLLLFGEGQETATVLKESPKGAPEPLVVLQRQFSIRRAD